MKEVGLNKIFVEGRSDKIFIETILLKYFGLNNKELVIDTNGKDSLLTQPDLADEMRKAENAKNLIIFDTDFIEKDGGREKRLREYNDIATNLSITFEIFLLPFNDEREGELENLVKTCFNKKFRFFDTCWNTMMKCFSSNTLEKGLNLPTIDGYIYSYVDLFEDYKERQYENKKTKIDFLDTGLWNLEINENAELKKLIDFISSNLFDEQK